jgi:hypothetical protein
MDIINSNSKGGVMYEQGAVLDVKKFEENWAKADSAIAVAPGALAGNRILPKPDTKYPQAIDHLLQFAVSSIYDAPGVNLELLGMADRDQPGVVETSRKKSAYTILAPFFDSLKSYRKEAGVALLEYIKEYLPERRIQEVLEEKLKPYAPMVKQIDLRQINVVVTESPQSDNNKEFVWAFASQIVPALLKLGLPVPPSILEYTPLPAALVEDWKKAISGGNPEQAAIQMKQQMQQMQQMMQQYQQEILKLKAQEQVKLTEIQNKKELGAAELEIEKTKLAIETEARITELQQKFALEKAKLEADIMLEKAKLEMQSGIKREEIQLNAQAQKESAKEQSQQPKSPPVHINMPDNGKMMDDMDKKLQEFMRSMMKPKKQKHKVMRNDAGKIVALETESMEA